MSWLGLLPLILFALVAIGELIVTVVVERAERRSALRNPMRIRNEFRPRIIQGGKAQAPPAEEEETPESRNVLDPPPTRGMTG